ncbi:MAG: hypothetical protein WD770_07555 [Actinomycetota bacterium]
MRSGRPFTAASLLAGACSIVAGAGYAMTPETGPAGARFGGFGDPWVVPAVAALGLLGGFAVVASLAAGGGRRRTLTVALLVGLAAGCAFGLWLFGRADPPLPPSWNWIRIPQAVGLAAAVVGVAAARSRIPRV